MIYCQRFYQRNTKKTTNKKYSSKNCKRIRFYFSLWIKNKYIFTEKMKQHLWENDKEILCKSLLFKNDVALKQKCMNKYLV